MPSLAMTLPLARRSPLYVPRRDVADIADFASEDAPKIITWIKRQKAK